MRIRVNGEAKNVRTDLTLHELLMEMELNAGQAGIAVAVDREVVPKTAWQHKTLRENSEVEIIRAVQGG